MPQTSYKDKSVLIIDNGLFVSLAELLVGQFGRVGYFCDWQSSFPDGRELVVGSGLEGIERVKYLWNQIDDFDLIVFPDCWNGDLQEYLRRMGKRVWGSGMKADLELARWRTKELLENLSLPVNEVAQVKGITALREYLQAHHDVFVKISALRGLGETFESEKYDFSKGQLDELEAKYGPLMDMVTFLCEKKIPKAKELGYDGYCIEQEFPNSAFFGAEVKDKAYFGKLLDYDALPDEVKMVNTKLSYEMKGYRQFFSSELRNQYPIDLTCRHASPAGEAFLHAMTNLADVLWNGAEGKLVHAEWSAKFAAQIIICSEWAEEHPLLVEFPEEIRPFVKLYNHCRVDGKDWVIPQLARMKQVGSVVGLGDTPEAACKAAQERAEQIKGYDLEIESEALEKARKILEESV